MGHSEALEELAEELLRGVLVPTPLHEDVEHIAVLVHRPPQVMAFTVDRHEHLVQVPFIARPGAPATQLVGILLAELAAPLRIAS